MAKNEDPLVEGQRLQAESVKAQEERDQIQPTPTQEEADKAKLGTLQGELEAPKDTEESQPAAEKAESADKPGSYKTRAAKAE